MSSAGLHMASVPFFAASFGRTQRTPPSASPYRLHQKHSAACCHNFAAMNFGAFLVLVVCGLLCGPSAAFIRGCRSDACKYLGNTCLSKHFPIIPHACAQILSPCVDCECGCCWWRGGRRRPTRCCTRAMSSSPSTWVRLRRLVIEYTCSRFK